MSLEKAKAGKPISVKDIKNLHVEEKAVQLLSNIMYQKAQVVKETLKKELNLSQSQFETILRKDSTRFTTMIMSGSENSIINERYYFDKKYIFTINVHYINKGDIFKENGEVITTITYLVEKENIVEDLETLFNIDKEEDDKEV